MDINYRNLTDKFIPYGVMGISPLHPVILAHAGIHRKASATYGSSGDADMYIFNSKGNICQTMDLRFREDDERVASYCVMPVAGVYNV